MVVYIHAHKRRLPRRSGCGDSHSLWYVVFRRGRGNSDPKILSCFFFCLFVFLNNVSNYNTASKTPIGMFLSLPNVHIFHIFTFIVWDILVGMCDLTYVRLTGLWLGSVPCVPGVSVSLLPSDTPVVWFIPLRRENRARKQKSPGSTYVSLPCVSPRCTKQSEPDTVEHLKVRIESTAPLRVRRHCSICDQKIRSRIKGSPKV